jgi:imidazolonepropionase-like amidohydrolase
MRQRRRIQWALSGALALGLLIPGWSGSEDTVVAVKGGRVFSGDRGTIDGGILIIRDGRIAAVGKELTIPAGAKIIDAAGSFIMPGLIDTFTNIGTEEPGTLGSDSDEKTAPLTPHLRIIDSFDPENPFIPLARGSGVTAALVAPGVGNLVAGQCGLMRLWGVDATAMAVRFPAAMQAALGEAPKMRFGSKKKTPQTRMGEAALLRQTFIDVQNYLQQISDYEKKSREHEAKEEKGEEEKENAPKPPAVDLKLQALVPVLKGELPLLVTANRFDDILTALRIADEFGLKIILRGGAEAYRLKDRLAAKKIPVLLKPEEAAARLTLETQRAVPDNATLLWRAGVKFAFQTGSVKDVTGLIRQARVAVANGLPRDEALRALTLNAAEIFGAAGELGSLEKGKSADVVIFEDDPLRLPAKVKLVIIRGEIVR